MARLLFLFVDLSMLNGTITVAYTDAEALPSVYFNFVARFSTLLLIKQLLFSSAVECGFSKLVEHC
jgi:hypothetical protein